MNRISMAVSLLLICTIHALYGEIVTENAPQPIKRALVTGGAGFLGSHMCDTLMGEGYEVICLDNLYTGSLNNIRHLMNNPHFKLVVQDIIDPYDPEISIDEIYNFACPASPPHYQKDPVHTLKTNVFGVINLLELAKKYQSKIFQSSTSEIYGDPLEHPQKESYWGNTNPIGIRSCYDEGKRAAETLFFDYFRQYGVRIKVGRIFNTYGPRMDPKDGRVVSNFIVQALNNQPITMYGDGSQTRSFCYVSDLISAIRSLMNSDESFHGPVNLGNPIEFNMLELAEKVIQLTESKSKIIFLPLPSDDPKKRRPDITLAKKILNWRPQTELREGLVKTIPYFRERLKQMETEQQLLPAKAA